MSAAGQDPGRLQAALADIARLAVTGGDITALLDGAVDIVHTGLGADFASVIEFEPGRRAVRLRAGRGWPQRPVGARLDVPADSALDLILEHGSLHMPDRARETRFDAEHPMLVANEINASLAYLLPGADSGQPYGTIGVHSHAPREFTALERDFLRGAAFVLAAAIARHRQALAVNDTVLQGLTVACYALERGDRALASDAVNDALDRARTLVSSLLGGAPDAAPALPGDLRRHRAEG